VIPNTQPVINLRNFVKEVYTAALNDTSTFAVLGMLRALLSFQSPAPADHPLSARFLYWCQLRADGNTGQDVGSTVTSAIRCLTTIGVCTEDNYPYSTPLWNTPTDAIFSDAQGTKIRQSHAVPQDLASLIQCLSTAHPFAFDVTTFASTFSDAVSKSGNIPMPGADELANPVGAESLLCVGCNQGPDQGFPDVNPGPPSNLVLAKVWPANSFLCVASRGTAFGLNDPHAGYVTIPFEYVTGSLASGHATIDVEV
jgi:hypothetical protein